LKRVVCSSLSDSGSPFFFSSFSLWWKYGALTMDIAQHCMHITTRQA
jgi:hypothetical protein